MKPLGKYFQYSNEGADKIPEQTYTKKNCHQSTVSTKR